MRILKSEEMKLVEQYATKFGMTYQRMMENAGAACARNIRNVLESRKVSGKKIIVVCGKGNNGGDGFVIARKFFENGYNVCVLLASGYPTSAEATYMYKHLLDLSIPTIWFDADKNKAIQTIKNADIIVDAVFGFSFYGSLSEEMQMLLSEMSNANGLKFAVDIPSGVYCDSGCCAKGCFCADYTVAISALKPAHILKPGCECCGDIVVANIGIPEESYAMLSQSLYTCDRNEIKAMFPKRPAVSNKGDFGHVLCICGSKKMPGAAIMCTKAALRSGAGLVTVAFPESAYIPLSSNLNEALLMPLKETEGGTLSREAFKELERNIFKFSSVVIGCGMGVNEDTVEIVRWIINNTDVPVIIDADGINAVATDINILHGTNKKLIITPHPKEMSRLTSDDVSLILTDPASYAKEFSVKHGVVTVLKGANTVVACPGSEPVYINSTGNNGLSKGGSGDVLAGLIGGFAAQFTNYSDAAVSAVYAHGMSADTVAEKYSARGMLPSDVIDEFRNTMKFFE